MCRDPRFNTILVLVLLILAACVPQLGTPSAVKVLGSTPPEQQINEVCDTCDQAAATAEIVRVNAQATLNSANATLSVAQTQDQNNADAIAAQIAATAEIVHANAQATLNSAKSTQNAATTQDAIRQTQAADLATTDAQSLLIQQNKEDLAAGTQTAIANNIATQTQAAAATSQWYSNQARQDEAQRRAPITFLWTWCFPVFIVLLVGLFLWGYWRRLRIQQDNQRILEAPIERLPPTIEIVPHQHDDSLPHIESDIIDDGHRLMKPDDQVREWLEEVKRTLLSRDKEDEDDHSND
ncbi:MAG TPA: hypothetical protein VLA72_12090 [Anaerolineales bacterium]|nr:hypothetical protein [Anaerolineales bacterium]